MKKNDIISLLKLDQSLIDEALRRQIDGTCCLKAEDRDIIQDLFDKTNHAIMDHIILEEESILPQIADEESALMREEHKKMAELLAEARHALVVERPVSFKVLMQALKCTMNEHEKVESHLFRSINTSEFDHEKIVSIHRRISEKVV